MNLNEFITTMAILEERGELEKLDEIGLPPWQYHPMAVWADLRLLFCGLRNASNTPIHARFGIALLRSGKG